MNTSQRGIDLIAKWEGLRLEAYKCPAGVWTIGYGHTAGVKPGMTCSKEWALAWLKEDVFSAEVAVIKLKRRFNQNQFDALVSFTYNCGSANLSKLCAGRSLSQISDAMLLYNKADGKVLTGLVNRRKEEKALFDEPVDISSDYYPAYTGPSLQIDTVFRGIGADQDYLQEMRPFMKRAPIADANGISGYVGTAAQNTKLVQLAKEGKLKRP